MAHSGSGPFEGGDTFVGICACVKFYFCDLVPYVLSSLEIISLRKKELVSLLLQCSACILAWTALYYLNQVIK